MLGQWALWDESFPQTEPSYGLSDPRVLMAAGELAEAAGHRGRAAQAFALAADGYAGVMRSDLAQEATQRADRLRG